MFTRAELNFKSKACVTQLKLRIVALSMIVGVPAWIGLTVLQRLGLGSAWGNSERIMAALLLAIYIAAVTLIVRRTQRDHGLVCPKCDGLLGAELRNVRRDGACAKCGEVIVTDRR